MKTPRQQQQQLIPRLPPASTEDDWWTSPVLARGAATTELQAPVTIGPARGEGGSGVQ